MASVGKGLGSLAGSLLLALMRGRAESQQTETLRKILDQQQRKSRGLDDMAGIDNGTIALDQASSQQGTFGNAPFSSPQDTPYIPNSQFPQGPQEGGLSGILGSLGDALSTAGRYTLEGLTPGNASADPLAVQIHDTRRANERKQSLADALAIAKAKAQFKPAGFTERMYDTYAKTHSDKEAMALWEANQKGGTGDLLAGELRKDPQALADYIKRQTTIPTKATKPTVRGVGADLQGIDPETGTIKWTRQGANLNPLPAAEASKLGAMKSLYEMTDKIKQQYDDPKSGLGEYVGPVVGRTGKLQESYGGSVPGLGELPKTAVEFRRNVTSIATLLAQMRSGAQISDQEYERLNTISPKITDPPNTFAGKLSGFLDEIRSLHSNKIDAFGEYRVPARLGTLGGASPQQAPRVSPQGGQEPIQPRYRITSGPLKGNIIDSKEALVEMVRKGQLSPNDSYEEGR